MIGRANTGGGITLHVIGGLTKPAGAGENTIWLNTNKTIGNWCIQNEAPESPEDGDVYITTRTATDNVLNISHPHDVMLYLGTPRQYDETEETWADVSGEVYYGGSWHNLQTFVYNGDLNAGADNFNSEVGGRDWHVDRSGGSAGTLTTEENYFQFSTSVTYSQYCYTENQIDFTDVKKVKITYSRTSGGNRSVRFIVFLTDTPKGEVQHYSASVEPPTTGNINTKNTVEIDTESLSGMYYLGYLDNANTGAGTLRVYEIELIS